MRTNRSTIVVITSAGLALGCSGLGTTSEPERVMNGTIEGTPVEAVCSITPAYSCPPPEEGISCNPPPPEEGACPPIINMAIQQTDGETCVLERRYDCPEDTICFGIPDTQTPCSEAMGDASRLVKHTPYGCAQVDEGEPHTYEDDTYAMVQCPPILERPLNEGWTLIPASVSDGVCMAIVDDPCPDYEEQTCNPPPPTEILCPG